MQAHTFFLDSPLRRWKEKSFSEQFAEEFANSSNVDIAVGYVGETSVRYLQQLCCKHTHVHLELLCGMQGVEGMTHAQIQAVTDLDAFLTSTGRGGVFIMDRVPYHGKIYLFQANRSKEMAAYIGSGNLNVILSDNALSTYDSGLFFRGDCSEITQYLHNDLYRARKSVSEVDIKEIQYQDPMTESTDATKVTPSRVEQILRSRSTLEFHLPLKTEPKSSLNAYRGGGGARRRKSGAPLKRSWYEGELIVGKAITSLPGYPQPGTEFNVVTDDGWKFRCKVSGQNGKNLRSAGNLATFGTWMKTRLLNAGAIEFGELAEPENIERYGRDHLTMKYHPDFDIWSFDMSVGHRNGLEIEFDSAE